MKRKRKSNIKNCKILPKKDIVSIADKLADKLVVLIKPLIKPDMPDDQTFRDLYWTSKNGSKTPLRDMKLQHIIHTIKFIESGLHGKVKTTDPIYKALKKELKIKSQEAKNKEVIIIEEPSELKTDGLTFILPSSAIYPFSSR